MPPDDGASLGLPGVFGTLMVFIAAAYAFGLPQAFLSRLWAAVATWREGRFSGRATVLAAILATLAWIGLVYSPLDAVDANAADKLSNAMQIAITPIGIASALFCRWLCGVLRLTRT